MNSPMPMLSIIFAIGMVAGGAVLAMLPPAPERPKPLTTSVRVADLAPPCKRQAGPSGERGCAPLQRQIVKPDTARVDVARATEPVEIVTPTPEPEIATPALPQTPPARPAIAAPVTPTPVPPRQRVAAAFAQLLPAVETIALSPPRDDDPVIAAAAPEAPRAPVRTKSDTARGLRNAAASGGPIPVTSVAANGARRTIVIRPTSQQDIYYYAARRQFAAANPARPQ